MYALCRCLRLGFVHAFIDAYRIGGNCVFCVAALSELCAVLSRTPATVFLIPGLIPLVPGGGMFQTMRAFVQGDPDTAARIGFTTLSAAGAIVLGIAISSSCAHIVFVLIKNAKVRKAKREN